MRGERFLALPRGSRPGDAGQALALRALLGVWQRTSVHSQMAELLDLSVWSSPPASPQPLSFPTMPTPQFGQNPFLSQQPVKPEIGMASF